MNNDLLVCFLFIDEVIECGVCHGASSILLPYFRKHTEHDEIGVSDMIEVACENVPAKYYKIVSQKLLFSKNVLS